MCARKRIPILIYYKLLWSVHRALGKAPFLNALWESEYTINSQKIYKNKSPVLNVDQFEQMNEKIMDIGAMRQCVVFSKP